MSSRTLIGDLTVIFNVDLLMYFISGNKPYQILNQVQDNTVGIF